MNLRSERTTESFIIYLQGDIDATTSLQVDHEINKIYPIYVKNLWIDLTQTNHLSSAGVGVFISHLQKLRKNKINLTLYGLKPKLKSVFTVLGLDNYLQIQPSLQDLTYKDLMD